jgi:hypothetical protein
LQPGLPPAFNLRKFPGVNGGLQAFPRRAVGGDDLRMPAPS